MKRRAVAACATVAAVLLGGVTSPNASARTPSWLKVTTASKATAYNGNAVVVRPSAVTRGHRVVTSVRVTAYRGKKRVAGGKTVRLKPGKYRTKTTGTYRAYKLVNRAATRLVVHEGRVTTATCRVTGTVSNGSGGTTPQATCTNAYYPTQRPSQAADGHAVGDTYTSSAIFTDEYVTQRYTAKVRSYGAKHRFSSTKRTLTVRDGGYRQVFTGSGNFRTSTFRSPGENWLISYSHLCFHDFGTFSVAVHRSDGDYVGGAASLGSGGGSVRQQGSGRFYLELQMASDCTWRVSIT